MNDFISTETGPCSPALVNVETARRVVNHAAPDRMFLHLSAPASASVTSICERIVEITVKGQ